MAHKSNSFLICPTPSAAAAGEAARSGNAGIVVKLAHGMKSRTGGCADAICSAFILHNDNEAARSPDYLHSHDIPSDAHL